MNFVESARGAPRDRPQRQQAGACHAAITDSTAPQHPHNQARGTYVTLDGITQPAPAPRFSRTQPEIAFVAIESGTGRDDIFRDWGIDRDSD